MHSPVKSNHSATAKLNLSQMSVRYTVVSTLRDESVLEEYVNWLRDSHVKDVIRTGGALSAEVLIKGEVETGDIYRSIT